MHVGDKVVCEVFQEESRLGVIRAVVGDIILNSSLYAIEFNDDSVDFHDCGGIIPSGKGLWVDVRSTRVRKIDRVDVQTMI